MLLKVYNSENPAHRTETQRKIQLYPINLGLINFLKGIAILKKLDFSLKGSIVPRIVYCCIVQAHQKAS